MLREFSIANQISDIVVEGDQIVFGGARSFARNAQTAWKKGGKGGGTYSLETLVHFVKTLDKPFKEYLRIARAPGVAIVPYLERKVGSTHAQTQNSDVPMWCTRHPLSLSRGSKNTSEDGQILIPPYRQSSYCRG